MKKKPEWIIALLITAAICALHFYYWLNIGGLWRDEVNLIVLSHRNSFADMAKDSFPVLMPLIVRFWFVIGLGGTDLHLRLIGLLVGLGTVAALWIGTWKIRREPPLIGLVLLCLNSTMIFFGDSLRAYGLGTVAAVMLMAAGFIFLQKPSALRTAWLALFAILSVQILYHNAVLVAAVCFGAWAVCWRRMDGRAAIQILIVAIVSAASLLPYAHILGILTSGQPTTLIFRTGATMYRLVLSCRDAIGYPLGGFIYVWGALTLMIVICACIGLWRSVTGKRRPASGTEPAFGRPADLEIGDTAGLETCATLKADYSLFASVTLLLGAIGFLLFFWRAQMPMQSWYLLPFMGLAVVCFDGARPDFSGLLRPVFIALVAGTALLSGLTTADLLSRHFSDVNIFAKEIAQDAGPSDDILVYPWNWGITFNYYYKGATPWDTVPPIPDHSIHRVDLMLADMENTNALAQTFEKIAQTLKAGHRVWFLGPASTQVPKPGTPPPPSLPPPPLKFWGWSERPYSPVWDSQTLQFIADHSQKFRQFKYSSLGIYLTEDMDIFMAEGWRTNQWKGRDGALRKWRCHRRHRA
ncbi:MAG TPA: hypothetical protein VH280_05055 [Verrucomicrobiae bacterium]|nr:hypothetical protein [Verrucomicrobiae bacterium]